MTTRYIPQLSFSFYRHRAIRADFSGGQITSDAGLLPLRAFDQRYGLTRGLAERVCDDRDGGRARGERRLLPRGSRGQIPQTGFSALCQGQRRHRE